MDVRDYLRLYWRQRWLILMIMLVGTVGTSIITALQPERIGVSETFAVNRIAQEPTPDYQYDGYYALQAADLFSQTVVSWFESASVIEEIYTAVNLDQEVQNKQGLVQRFSVKRFSSQNILIKFTESSDRRARSVAAGVRTVLEQRASRLNRGVDDKPLFEILGSTPVLNPTKPNPWIFAAVGLVLSFGLGLFVAASRYYLKDF